MPEGDVVWATAQELARAFDGHVLTRGELRVPRFAGTDLAGRRVLETVSRGKHLLTRLDGDVTLHTHLRMDGVWRIVPLGRRPPPGDIVRAILADDERQAFGIRLGITELVPTDAEGLDHLGPDLLEPGWSGEDEAQAVRNLNADPERTIGEALLDQRNLAGLGTIFRAETLFLRGLSPWRPVKDVPDPEAVVRLARRLLDANKDRPGVVTTGDRREPLWVYGRARRACRRCGTLIRRGELGAEERLAFWCPACQT